MGSLHINHNRNTTTHQSILLTYPESDVGKLLRKQREIQTVVLQNFVTNSLIVSY